MTDSGTEGRAIDRSDPENTGAPRRMRATCLQCGDKNTGACVTVWLNVNDGRSEPRDDVSFRCRNCGEVTERKVEILERGPGSS